MNIGIDVDGTLIDIGSFMLRNGETYFGRQASDPSAIDIEQMFACTYSQRNRFWSRHIFEYCKRSPMIEGASESIEQLRRDGHGIYIVTSRVFTTLRGPVGARFRRMLRGWLAQQGVVYDDIVFCEDTGMSKLEQCRRLNVGVMIDDKPDNLITISKEIPVIAAPMPWNADLVDERVIKASDWGEIYRIISGMA
ncbi:Uncharacterized protein, HAD superfamily [Ruminococcaceae bacterium YRB3002]|nr:Uncharacterized protein, HAD superfamily [Ruminococcaceae bacterium YRB3002]